MLALGAAATLAGCAHAVPLTAAPQASDPACAGVVVLLPEEVAGQAERETDAQGTGAWGEPASIILHCGVESPGPTTLTCQNVSGVDWIVDDADAPNYRFTSYGREPAVEVYLDSDVVAGSTVMADLAAAVSTIPQTRACTEPVAG
ncbi:DUF3515 family protein [Agromyces archimandritae]|uniref:DUF3515 family protein n=1 Tax=Agromyces archimandritae TaxID=2781962 RepID=A0A975FQX8_9MICO|nr:DUF3515 family protein [Agromyces archimandritae]